MSYDVHTRLRAIARDFSVHEILPLAIAMDREGGIQLEMVERLAATGWFGLCVPKEFGGLGLGHVAKTIAIEEVSRCSAAAGATLQSAQLGIPAILDFGTDHQKKSVVHP